VIQTGAARKSPQWPKYKEGSHDNVLKGDQTLHLSFDFTLPSFVGLFAPSLTLIWPSAIFTSKGDQSIYSITCLHRRGTHELAIALPRGEGAFD
jgi:hypothetical protein